MAILRRRRANVDDAAVESPLERTDVDAILRGIFDANVRLITIIDFLEIDDGEEEEEDPDA